MKNPMVIFILVIALAVAGFVGYTYTQQNKMSDDSMMKKDEAVMASDDSMMKKDDAMMKAEESTSSDKMMMSDKKYVEYSKQALSDASKTKRVLFFYASWCPTCRPSDTDFRANESKIPSDITVIRVNYNDPETDQEEKDLAKKYGITYQHTFVQIDGSGNQVTKWNGGKITELLANIK